MRRSRALLPFGCVAIGPRRRYGGVMRFRFRLARGHFSLDPELDEAPQERELALGEQRKYGVGLFLGDGVEELLGHLLAHVVLAGASVREELSNSCLAEGSENAGDDLGLLEALLP